MIITQEACEMPEVLWEKKCVIMRGFPLWDPVYSLMNFHEKFMSPSNGEDNGTFPGVC